MLAYDPTPPNKRTRNDATEPLHALHDYVTAETISGPLGHLPAPHHTLQAGVIRRTSGETTVVALQPITNGPFSRRTESFVPPQRLVELHRQLGPIVPILGWTEINHTRFLVFEGDLRAGAGESLFSRGLMNADPTQGSRRLSPADALGLLQGLVWQVVPGLYSRAAALMASELHPGLLLLRSDPANPVAFVAPYRLDVDLGTHLDARVALLNDAVLRRICRLDLDDALSRRADLVQVASCLMFALTSSMPTLQPPLRPPHLLVHVAPDLSAVFDKFLSLAWIDAAQTPRGWAEISSALPMLDSPAKITALQGETNKTNEQELHPSQIHLTQGNPPTQNIPINGFVEQEAKSNSVQEMDSTELVRLLTQYKLNPRLTKIFEKEGCTGPEFMSLTEKELMDEPFLFSKFDIRRILELRDKILRGDNPPIAGLQIQSSQVPDLVGPPSTPRLQEPFESKTHSPSVGQSGMRGHHHQNSRYSQQQASYGQHLQSTQPHEMQSHIQQTSPSYKLQKPESYHGEHISYRSPSQPISQPMSSDTPMAKSNTEAVSSMNTKASNFPPFQGQFANSAPNKLISPTQHGHEDVKRSQNESQVGSTSELIHNKTTGTTPLNMDGHFGLTTIASQILTVAVPDNSSDSTLSIDCDGLDLQVLRSFKTAWREHQSVLSLSKLGLKIIPDSLTVNTSLLILDLRGNQLSTLPKSINQLVSLEQLFVAGNPIQYLPETISELEKLSVFTVDPKYFLDDVLRSLLTKESNPKTYAAIVKKYFKFPIFASVGVNQLVCSAYVQSQTTLELIGCGLSSIPTSFSLLTSLIRLNLSENILTSIGDGIPQLSNLVYLNLSDNKLSSLPPMNEMVSLSAIYLGGNLFQKYPVHLRQLPKLTSIILDENPLEDSATDQIRFPTPQEMRASQPKSLQTSNALISYSGLSKSKQAGTSQKAESETPHNSISYYSPSKAEPPATSTPLRSGTPQIEHASTPLQPATPTQDTAPTNQAFPRSSPSNGAGTKVEESKAANGTAMKPNPSAQSGVAGQTAGNANGGDFEVSATPTLKPKRAKKMLHIVTASEDKTVRVWSLGQSKETCRFTLHENCVGGVATFTEGSDMRPLVASGGGDRLVRVWDPLSGVQLFSMSGHSSVITRVASLQDTDPDVLWSSGNVARGKTLLASCSRDRMIRIWNTKTRRCVSVLTGHTSAIFAICESGMSGRLASGGCLLGGCDLTVRLWDYEAKRMVLSMTGHTGHINSLTPLYGRMQDHVLVSASGDHSIRIWDTRMGQEAGQLAGHSLAVMSVAAIGNTVASGSDDHSVRLWDIRTMAQTAQIGGQSMGVHAVSLFRDPSDLGLMVASGGWDKSMRTYLVDPVPRMTQLHEGHKGLVCTIAYFSTPSRTAK